MGIISFCIILILTYLLLGWVSPKIAIPKSWLVAGWTIKIGFSVAFLHVFIVYYGHGNLYGDAFNFINDSRLLYEFGLENPVEYFKLLFGLADETRLFETTHLHETNIWSYGDNGDLINDNRLLIRINSLIHFISFGNVYVHALVLSFISFLGILLLYCSFKRFFTNQRLAYFMLTLFPSIGFWCSGITKESLMLFGMGSFLFGFTRLIKNAKAQHSILLLAGTGILLYNKPHVGIILLSLSSLLIVGVLTKWNQKWLKVFPLLFVSGLIFLTYTPPSVNLLHKVSYKQKDLINIGKGGIFFVNDSSFCAVDFQYLSHFDRQLSDTLIVNQTIPAEYKLFGDYTFHPFTIVPSTEKYPIYLIQPPSASYIDVIPVTYSRKQLALNTPSALTNVLLRPYPWDPGSPLKYFSFIENILLLLILIFAFIYRKKTSREENYFIMYFVISALAIALLIGWTTPILGAIVRYKVAVNLLLLITAGILLRPVNKSIHET